MSSTMTVGCDTVIAESGRSHGFALRWVSIPNGFPSVTRHLEDLGG